MVLSVSDDDGFDDGQDEEAAIFQPLAGAAAAMELNDIESRSTTPRGVGLRRKVCARLLVCSI